MLYRKKPVVIEAIQYDGTEKSLVEIVKCFNSIKASVSSDIQDDQFIIETLEGSHIASPGDYIIKGVKNEFYPCKPDIFKMTYEKVEEK